MEPALEGGKGTLLESGCSVSVQHGCGCSVLGVRLLLEIAAGDDAGAVCDSRGTHAGIGVVEDVMVSAEMIDTDSLGGNAGAGERRRQRRAVRGIGEQLPKGGMRGLERRIRDEDAETVGKGGLGAACR